MSKDRRLPADCQRKLWSMVDGWMRFALTQLLQAFMEHERDLMLAAAPYERTERRRGRRNGYDPRWLDTRFGPLRLRKPKVRDAARPFTTKVFDRYERRTGQVDDCVRRWVAGGLSTRSASATLAQAFDVELSAASVSAVLADVDSEIRAFHTRLLPRG